MKQRNRIGRFVRTVRHLAPGQAFAQLVFALRGLRSPGPAVAEFSEFRAGPLPVPFLPGPAHARWHASSELELIGRRVNFSTGVDWGFAREGPLWLYHLHQCDHLRGQEIPPSRRLSLILAWIRDCSEGGPGWDPHPTSLRILSWGKLLLTPGAIEPSEAERALICGSLARQLEHLDRNLEFRLGANHLLSNLVGMVFGGLLLEGRQADGWLARSAMLGDELAAQFGSDGAHQERSPMYHGLLVENLLDLLNLARVRSERAPDGLVKALEATASAALGAMSVWRHPDGEIALFGDSAFGIAQSPDALVEYGGTLGLNPRLPATPGLLEAAGFARLERGDFALAVSIGGPAPAHQPGHAHCDALAFELACRGQRVVCDTGVYAYLPGERRTLARATRSHATLEVGGEEQAEIWAAHRVGGRPEVKRVDFRPGQWLEGTCVSWSTPGTLHRRRFVLEGDVLEIWDGLEGEGLSAVLSLPLAPGIEPRLAQDADGVARAYLDLPQGGELRVDLPGPAQWRIERRPYYPEFGQEIQRACLVGEAPAFASGTWRFVLSD